MNDVVDDNECLIIVLIKCGSAHVKSGRNEWSSTSIHINALGKKDMDDEHQQRAALK